MSKWSRVIGLAGLLGVAMLSAGCMALSLFSSDHTHYHEGAELRERVNAMEKRLDAIQGRTTVVAPEAHQH